MKDAIGLAFDYARKRVFYSDIQRGAINSVAFDGTAHRTLLDNVGSVEGLVYDRHSETLYWTCNADNSIGKAKIGGYSSSSSGGPVDEEKVVQLGWNDKPRGIDVDACSGMIYFTNWNAHEPSVMRVWSSGFGLEAVVTTDIRMPNAIAVDSAEKAFYWGDAREAIQ